MRDTIVATKDVLAESLAQDDVGEMRFRIRTALQLLDAVEHKLEETDGTSVLSDLVAENEGLRDQLAELGVGIDD